MQQMTDLVRQMLAGALDERHFATRRRRLVQPHGRLGREHGRFLIHRVAVVHACLVNDQGECATRGGTSY